MPEASDMIEPWLSIVGIGEGGLDGLSTPARAAIAQADCVIGGERHLALARELIRGEARLWPVPFTAILPDVMAMRGRPTCILASGDPFWFGAGSSLVGPGRVAVEETIAHPAPSSLSLAAARLGWPLQDCIVLGLNGRDVRRILPHLHPGTHILALCADEKTSHQVAALLSDNGFGPSILHVLEHLGGASEQLRQARADAFSLDAIRPLNLLGISVRANPGARILARGFGLDDALFEHDGQLTKREIRAVTLAALAPRRGEILWDIGCGSGSIAIEWLLADPLNRAFGIEQDETRAARIARNAAAFGVSHLRIIMGQAPAALEGLPEPDAIFIGGGLGDGVLKTAMLRLKSGGRLVANAVTLEGEAALLAAYAAHGGHMIRLNVERASPVGHLTGWRPAMPVTQWSFVKP